MIINEDKSFKAVIAQPDGNTIKARVNIQDGIVNVDYGVKFNIFVMILLVISIIGICIFELATYRKISLHKMFALNEVKAMRIVNTKLLPKDKNERKTMVFAVGYKKLYFIATNPENEFYRYILEQNFEELDYEEYKTFKDEYDKNEVVIQAYYKRAAKVFLVLIAIALIVLIFTPLIITLSQQSGM